MLVSLPFISSSTMSLTTFFGLICLVYTYFGITNTFDIDICDISSCYGLLQLISINYQKQCLSEHIFGWLLMSHDTSPFLDVLLESKHQIFLVFLCFYLNIPIVLQFDYLCLICHILFFIHPVFLSHTHRIRVHTLHFLVVLGVFT